MLSIGLATPAAVFAEETSDGNNVLAKTASGSDDDYEQQWPDPPDTGAMLLRLGLGTLFVLALCVGTLWFGRRWLTGAAVIGRNGGTLKLEESVSLGNRCFIHLLRVGDARIVAGTDSSGLKTLVTLPLPFEGVLENQLKPAAAAEPDSQSPVPLREIALDPIPQHKAA